MLSFHFFSICGRGTLDISMATERHVREVSRSGNLLEMSENLAVRSLCPMSDHLIEIFRSDEWPLQGGSLFWAG